MRTVIWSCLIGALVAAFAASSAAAKEQPLGAQLAKVRAATAKYHNVANATADGYVQVSPCVASAEGGMGFHYRKDALLDGQINPLTPEVLVYERKDNGKLRLVAVEYFEWASTVNNVAPTAFGRTLLGPQTHGIDPHFELHAWLWKHNSSGMFAQWNPRVSCAG